MIAPTATTPTTEKVAATAPLLLKKLLDEAEEAFAAETPSVELGSSVSPQVNEVGSVPAPALPVGAAVGAT